MMRGHMEWGSGGWEVILDDSTPSQAPWMQLYKVFKQNQKKNHPAEPHPTE